MRIKGIVIKKTDFKEYDQLATFYTEEFGRIRGVAKSVLKPHSKQSRHLDNLNLVDFELVSGSGYPIITSAISKNCYLGIKNNLVSLALALFLSDMAYKMTYENDPDPILWDFLKETLEYLNEVSSELDKNNFKPILTDIQKKFYSVLGFLNPNADSFSVLEEFYPESSGALQFLNDVVKY